MKPTLGFLIVATGRYYEFVSPLVESIRAHTSRTDFNVKFFLFTDALSVPEGVARLNVEHLPFPHPTLARYHFFLRYRAELSSCTHLVYCDADLRFIAAVGNEILGKLVAVVHPGHYSSPKEKFPYERNPSSTTYIPSGQGEGYFCGGVQGGEREAFLKASEVMAARIEKDQKRGITAIWHDESHWNRYLLDNPPSHVLSPSYAYPEGWQLPFPPKILALEKDHRYMRGLSRWPWRKWILDRVKWFLR